jgi:hypothetical protein
MQSAVAHRVFDTRSGVELTLNPNWERLRQQAATWQRLDREPGSPLDRYGRYLEWAQHGTRYPDADLALAVAYFLPRSSPAPGTEDWLALCDVAMSASRPHPYDPSLAWAAGWRPGRAVGPFQPGQVGELAVLALAEQVEASVAVTLRLLESQTGIAIVDREEVASTAYVITMSLLGVCDCGHHLRECGRRCGRSCCFLDHDLRTWNPDVCHLRPFIDQAVRGTALRRILGGAFASGMLFRILEAEGRLLCRTVEWARCDDCGRTFEGTRCPSPHRPPDVAARREPRKNQLIVPAGDSGPGHVPIKRWWCANCHHLYGSAISSRRGAVACPRCGTATTTTKAVWTLAAHRRPTVDQPEG